MNKLSIDLHFLRPGYLVLLSGLAAGFFFAACSVQADSQVTFESLMSESGLSFSQPENMKREAPVSFEFFGFDKGFKHNTLDLEIHYAIRPIARMETTSYDAHGAVPEPNHLYTMIFKSLSSNLAEGTRNHRRNYTADLAKELFNAGWASASQFKTSKDIGTKYSSGILLAIHKNNLADAFTLFLFNDAKAVKPFINKYATSLKFKSAAK